MACCLSNHCRNQQHINTSVLLSQTIIEKPTSDKHHPGLLLVCQTILITYEFSESGCELTLEIEHLKEVTAVSDQSSRSPLTLPPATRHRSRSPDMRQVPTAMFTSSHLTLAVDPTSAAQASSRVIKGLVATSEATRRIRAVRQAIPRRSKRHRSNAGRRDKIKQLVESFSNLLYTSKPGTPA